MRNLERLRQPLPATYALLVRVLGQCKQRENAVSGAAGLSERILLRLIVLVCVLSLCAPYASAQDVTRQRVLWTDPGDIASRNLFYGVGGKDQLPKPPVQFLDEDKGGTNPKLDVEDQAGTKWKIKLGIESKPEIAASRLLWAVGYFVNENYYVPELKVSGAGHLRRGREFMNGDHLESARLQRHLEGEKKIGDWSWHHNPFKTTREFDGLRVMMALISNWDLKDENNAILTDKNHPGSEIYEVSDVGTAFGTSGKSYSSNMSKSNLGAYKRHKFVSRVGNEHVDLNFPTHPSIIHFFEFPFFWGQMRNRWIGRHIPRDHVRWIASMLAQLTPTQIEDAFRAAGYSPDQVQSFSQAVEARIAELQKI